MRIDPPAASRSARLPFLDAARGAAVLAMVVYHFCWDLRFFGYIAADVADGPGWVLFARAIAASFLFIVGLSLVLAARNGINWPRYWRRLGVVVAAALGITAATWFAFPESFIFFGILHHIAVASVIALPFIRAHIGLVLLAAVFSFVAPAALTGPAFDHPALVWLGLATYFPRANDFVPIFPWFGVVLTGIATARLAPVFWHSEFVLPAFVERPPRSLLRAGRYSLAIYLLHQPILFGALYAASVLAPPDLLNFESAYLESCARSCAAADHEAELCRRTCACLAERSQEEGLWNGMMRQTLTKEENSRYFTLADSCSDEAERLQQLQPDRIGGFR